ncbi:MAG: tRNA guanosine(34) transglycosylase Tgt [Patescibacteria group bacterium]
MFKILKKDPNSRARLGVLETPHGEVETPSYVNVGTHAKVRELSSADLAKTKTQIIIANTYHLWQKLGDEGLKKYHGLHAEMNWSKPLVTDSGGFQVFSLGFARELGVGKVSNTRCLTNHTRENLVRITDDGVYFKVGGKEEFLDASSFAKVFDPDVSDRRASEDGRSYFLSPEKSIWIQQQLGADIILAFDEPTSPLHDYEYTRESLRRTHRWAVRSIQAKTTNQKIYGIVQGGQFEDLRKESAKYIGSLGFDGIAIGGSFGSSFGAATAGRLFRELDWVVPYLPENKPRHMLGIGLVEDLFMGVEKGIDTFDCVVPTREGRHGNVYVSRGERGTNRGKGEIDIHRGIYENDPSPIDPECACEVCAVKKISRGRLHALFKAKDREAGYLASFHNVYFFNDLMEKIRGAIKEGKFGEFKSQYV